MTDEAMDQFSWYQSRVQNCLVTALDKFRNREPAGTVFLDALAVGLCRVRHDGRYSGGSGRGVRVVSQWPACVAAAAAWAL